MKEKIHKAVEVLKNGGIILYPTDTIWGIGCDATNAEAVDKIYKLKQRNEEKSMIILVENDRRLQNIVDVPDLAWDLIDLSEKPTTIIYDEPKDLAKNVVAKDNTIGIRLIEPMFLKQLIGKLNKPLVSTSANISDKKSPTSFKDISKEILNGVDYILDINTTETKSKSSCIIKLTKDSQIKIIRK
ncbi:MAG: threonylcarbamoyl-AMP synthase [Ichthyobacteriaceae bacterium]|nr:threonylcarbamoyl-AMP synthase [Ichthyobacteriaceae bacterium]